MKKPQPKYQPAATRSPSEPARELVRRDLDSVTGGATSVEYALMLISSRADGR